MACHCDESRSAVPLKIKWVYGAGPSQKISAKRIHLRADTEDDGDVLRKRKAHQKVRTGCVTCKIRRKKCDEAKPSCRQCTDTGRKCEGYSETRSMRGIGIRLCSPSSSSTTVNDESKIVLDPFFSVETLSSSHVLCRSPNSLSALEDITDLDRYCFTYFKYCTYPQFTSYFDVPISCGFSLMRRMYNPAMFSAIVALGAVHRRFSYGISREAFEFCAHSDRLQEKALLKLKAWKEQNLRSGDSHSHQTSMMTETLLSMFEAFQDRQESSMEHMSSAVEHLVEGGIMKLMRSERRHCMVPCAMPRRSRIFCTLLFKLYCQLSMLLGSPVRILAKRANSQTLPTIPHIFANLEDARDFVFTEIDWACHSSSRWEDLRGRSQAQFLHSTRLAEWGHAYLRTVRSMSRTPRQRKACDFLRLARNAAYLLMFIIFFADTTVYKPLFLPPFPMDPDDTAEPRVTHVTQSLQTAASDLSTLDMNLGSVKVSIQTLLDDTTVWDSHDDERGQYECQTPELGIYSVANKTSADGDAALLALLKKKFPRYVDMGWLDITCMLEDQVLMLRYHVPHEDGVGYWWTQEWWKL